MRLNSKITTSHMGYQLQGYAKSLLTVDEVRTLYKKLNRIPSKISTFVDRKTIKEAFKHNEFTYFILDTNGDIFILDY